MLPPHPLGMAPSLPFLHTCTWEWQGEFLLPPAPLWSSCLHCLFRDQNWARKEKIQPHKAWQLRTLPEASRSQAKQYSWEQLAPGLSLWVPRDPTF